MKTFKAQFYTLIILTCTNKIHLHRVAQNWTFYWIGYFKYSKQKNQIIHC